MFNIYDLVKTHLIVSVLIGLLILFTIGFLIYKFYYSKLKYDSNLIIKEIQDEPSIISLNNAERITLTDENVSKLSSDSNSVVNKPPTIKIEELKPEPEPEPEVKSEPKSEFESETKVKSEGVEVTESLFDPVKDKDLFNLAEVPAEQEQPQKKLKLKITKKPIK